MSERDHKSLRKIGRLGRSKSTGTNNGKQSPSPPGQTDGDTTHNPLIPPPSPSTTPPKKKWERHYRSFLTRKQMGGGTSPNSAPSSWAPHSDGNHSAAASPADVASSKRTFFPGSRRLFRNTSRGSNNISSRDALDTSKMPPMPVLTKTKSSDEETAVRGGNLFGSMFQQSQSKSIIYDARSEQHRRVKSVDALDNTMRRGHEKVYSPITTRVKNSVAAQVGVDAERPVRGGEASQVAMSNLPRALSTTGHKTKEMKKAFTAFHNSSKFAPDSTSAYLGDDPSVQRNTYFADYNQGVMAASNSFSHSERHGHGVRPISSRHSLSALDTVDENVQVHRAMRMLRKIQGPDKWESGRRYLVAPAALSTCPLKVLSILSGSDRFLKDYGDTPFGTVELGQATVSYAASSRKSAGWSTCRFLLRQNYLMEYDMDGTVYGYPRGYAHLQYSRAYEHPDFSDALELEFYLSPCARADKRVLFMRVESEEERDRWVMCLNDAANLEIRDFYEFEEGTEFGRGRYAAVYPARRRTLQKLTNHPSDDKMEARALDHDCALKIIDKNEFWRRVVKGIERSDTLVREASVQATLTAHYSHLSSFLQLRSFFETSAHIVMELELVQGKDLFRYVSSKGYLAEKEAAEIMQDLLVCLEAMRRIGLSHRDIKPANMLMCDKERQGVCIKLGDFGMSTFVGVDGLVRGRCGTPGYVAPEIFEAGVNAGYGNKVDVFSAGVTLYVMLCGYEPFYGESDAELIAANKEARVEFQEEDWTHVSPEARDLVLRMMAADPNKRADVNDALNHEWIRKHAPESPVLGNITSSMDDMALSSDSMPNGTTCNIC